MIPEEQIQIIRGDVPYFFRTFLSKEIFYFKSKNEAVAITNLPPKFKKIAETVGHPPKVILSEVRLKEKTIPIGTLSLVASFFCQMKDIQKIELNGASIDIQPTNVVLHSDKRYELRV